MIDALKYQAECVVFMLSALCRKVGAHLLEGLVLRGAAFFGLIDLACFDWNYF